MSATVDLDSQHAEFVRLRDQAFARTDQPTPESASRAVVVALNTVQPRAIEWLWPMHLATGKLHLLGGHPGDGKSTITLALAAAFSRGGMAPDGYRLPVANTLVVAAEDDIADTIVPRLLLHDADTRRVFALKHVVDEKGNDRALSLGSHVEEIRAVITQHEIRLVIIDPITSYLPKADRNAEGDVRDALMPLLRLIEETGIAVIGVMHLGKGGAPGRKPLQMLLGSTAFGAIARVVWMTGELPEEEQPAPGPDGMRETRKVLGVVKSNIGMRPPALEWSRPMDGRIRWYGPSKHQIDDLLSGGPASKLEAAIENIEHQLRNGPKAQKLVESEAADLDISKATLKRAYEQLRSKGCVKASKASYPPHPWLWEWTGSPDEDVHASQPDRDELLRSDEEEQDAHLHVFPERREDVQGVHGDLLHSYPEGRKEEAQEGHRGRMSFFGSRRPEPDPDYEEVI